MHLGASTEVLLRIGEEIVWASPNQIGAADFGICNGKLSIATLRRGANELVRCEKGVVSSVRRVGDCLRLWLKSTRVQESSERAYLP